MKQAVPVANLLQPRRLNNQSASAASTTTSTAGGLTSVESLKYVLETSTIAVESPELP